MYKKPLILIAALFLSGALWSQQFDFTNFQTLRSAGPVPDDFTEKSSVKFQRDKSDIETESKREKKDMESFLLASNYEIEDMLHSGRVLFGDPVTNYLNDIKKEILKDDPKLAESIRIYTLLSNEVNAFTFDNGIVVVTTGLVSQVQNEAQLAYILCHEFVHFTEKHAITSYVESQRVERGSGVYASLSRDEEDLVKFSYAKEQETEADEKGLELYKTTKYSYDAMTGVFDVLLYSYLPINEIEFPRNYFNEGLYELPQTVFLDTINEITAVEDYDDAKSTHPNIKRRKEDVLSELPVNNDAGRSPYVLGEDRFNEVQKIARFQGCELFLMDIQYEEALYQAFILQQEEPDNAYLKRVVAQALYGWSMYKNAGATPDVHTYYKKIEGESQQVYYIFNKLNAKEFNILALKYAWDVHLAEPDNAQFTRICKQLGKELANEHDMEYDNFYTAAQSLPFVEMLVKKNDSIANATPADSVKTIDTKTSKYDKIKKEKTTPDEKSPYWKFAFTSIEQDKEFKDLFEKEEEETVSTTKKKKRNKPEFNLGLKELVVVDPIYISIDERSDNPVQYQAAEASRATLKEKVKSSASELNLKVEYLDHGNIDERDADAFNDMAILSRWLHEKLSHLDEEVYLETSTTDELQQLATKYDIDHFAWMGIVSFTETEQYVGAKIFLCIYLPLAPFLIYDLVTPDRNTFYFALVANAETGKFEMQYYNSNTLNDSNAAQASNIYYILQQIRSSKK